MTPFDYRLTGPIGSRATLGLVVLQTDETVEQDMRRLLPLEGVALYVTRVPSGLEVSTDSLGAMEQALPGAAGLFPGSVSFDAVGYGCTSGTSVIGVDRVAALVSGACHAKAVTQPVSGLVAACGRLEVKRLAFLSPYVAEVSGRLRGVLAGAGIESPVFGSFDEAEEAKVARIDPESIFEAACGLASRGGMDALFLSCTNLRTLDVIDRIEAQTGLPVLSSNQVMIWHMGQLAGLGGAMTGPGRLFQTV